MVNEFDPQAFGSVLARLDAQDRQLRRLEQDLSDLGDKLDLLIVHSYEGKVTKRSKPDYWELFIGGVLGAVTYFFLAKVLGQWT